MSALILLVTIGKQVHKQWRSGSTEGVSSWLFIGQTAAPLGFAVYSGLTGNWVFLTVNAALLRSGIAGQPPVSRLSASAKNLLTLHS